MERYSLYPTGVAATDTKNFYDAMTKIPYGVLYIRDTGRDLVIDGELMKAHNSNNSFLSISKEIFLLGENKHVTIQMNNGFRFAWGAFERPPYSGLSSDFAGATAGLANIVSADLALEKGDWVAISGDDALTGLVPHSDVQCPAEIARVEYVSGTSAWLSKPVIDTMSIRPRIRKLAMLRNCGIAQLRCTTTDADDGNLRNAFEVNKTVGFIAEDLFWDDPGPGAIVFDNSAMARVSGFNGTGQVNNNGNYVVSVATVCDFEFSDSVWHGGRHIFTTSGAGLANHVLTDDYRWGTPRDVIVKNVTANIAGYGGQPDNLKDARSIFDTHAEGYGIEFRDCLVITAYQQTAVNDSKVLTGFRSRSRATRFINSRMTGNKSRGASYDSGDNFHIGFVINAADCEIRNCATDNLFYGVRMFDNPERCRIVRSTFHDCKMGGVVVTQTGTSNSVNGIDVSYNRFTGETGRFYFSSGNPVRAAAHIIVQPTISGMTIRHNVLDKLINTWAVGVGANSTSAFKLAGNSLTGYGAGKVGVCDGVLHPVAEATAFNTAFASQNFTD